MTSLRNNRVGRQEISGITIIIVRGSWSSGAIKTE